MQKVKKHLRETTSNRVYNLCLLFLNDDWNRHERMYRKRKWYGRKTHWNTTTKFWESTIRYPNWKFQKVKRQWEKKPWVLKNDSFNL